MNPNNQAAIRLGQRLQEMSTIGDEAYTADLTALEKRHRANVEEWKAFLSTEGSIEHRKTTARLNTAELSFAADLAEAELRHQLRTFRIAEKRVDAGRTYSADMRAEAYVAGRDGTP